MRVLIFVCLVLLGCTKTYMHRTVINMPDTLKVVVIPASVVVDSAKIEAKIKAEEEAKRLRAGKEIVAWFEKAFGYFVFDHRGDYKTWFELKYSIPGGPKVFKWVRYEFVPERHSWNPTANWEEE